MIKILEVNPNTNDAMSFYRGRGPLQHLQKKYRKEIDFHPMGPQVNNNWDFLNIFDAVFIIRPYGDQHVELIKTCVQFGIPVWIDFDDLLIDVPIDNPAHIGYRDDSCKKIIHQIMKMCTVCTFATEHLMKEMGKNILHKSFVVPNAHNTKLLRFPMTYKPYKKVVWRGSSTHIRDLQQFEGPVREVMRDSGWVTEFMGDNPIHITDYIEAIYTPYMNKNRYFQYLSEIEGSINIVPLSHRESELNFNKSKSNIAWLESTYAGMVSLAPDWQEWQKPGIINFKDHVDFREKLTAMIKGEYDLKALQAQSWQYIQDELSLDKINEIRYEIICSNLKLD